MNECVCVEVHRPSLGRLFPHQADCFSLHVLSEQVEVSVNNLVL